MPGNSQDVQHTNEIESPKIPHEHLVAYLRGSCSAAQTQQIAATTKKHKPYELLFELVDQLQTTAGPERQSPPKSEKPVTFLELDDLLMQAFSGNLGAPQAQRLLDALLTSPLCYQRILIKLSEATPELVPKQIPEMAQVPVRSDASILADVVAGGGHKGKFNLWATLKKLTTGLKVRLHPLNLRPAAWGLTAAALVLLLLVVGQGRFRSWRAEINTRAGLEQLHEQWTITDADLRPPGDFPRSIFSVTLGAEPAPGSDPALPFENALKWNKKNRAAKHGLAIAWYFTGQYAKADSLVNALISEDSLDHEAWNMRGLLAAQRENSDRAIEAFNRALRIRPDYAEAAYNRALLLQQTGQLKEARKAWQEYLKIDKISTWSETARKQLKDKKSLPDQ
ncbi:MAG: tetratricopeptide repeat protein [bacterium]